MCLEYLSREGSALRGYFYFSCMIREGDVMNVMEQAEEAAPI